MSQSKDLLLVNGFARMQAFCEANRLEVPPVNVRSRQDWEVGMCAYYRPVKIEICVEACASIGHYGRQWSYPGYTVDRTPYGVIAHELGHHADRTRSARRAAYFGDYSIAVRKASSEAKLTNYCPNDAEWFAEMFRLFVTNPDLLAHLRPRTFALLAQDFMPVEQRSWKAVLYDAPQRTRDAAQRKVDEARTLL